MAAFDRVMSGIPALDQALDNIRLGDNVVWEVSSLDEFRAVAQPFAEQAVRDFRERYVPIGLYESRPFPGMKDLLRELKAAGYQLAVTTSKPQVLAEELLRRGELYELFDCICGAADQGEGNAKWQVLRRAMERLRAPEEESLLIGDTKYDVAGAKRCGVKCIGVGYGYAARGELENAGADAVAPDLAALREMLLS